jgi:hypothetical protein
MQQRKNANQHGKEVRLRCWESTHARYVLVWTSSASAIAAVVVKATDKKRLTKSFTKSRRSMFESVMIAASFSG